MKKALSVTMRVLAVAIVSAFSMGQATTFMINATDYPVDFSFGRKSGPSSRPGQFIVKPGERRTESHKMKGLVGGWNYPLDRITARYDDTGRESDTRKWKLIAERRGMVEADQILIAYKAPVTELGEQEIKLLIIKGTIVAGF